MNKSEKVALCLYCKRKVEKYSDVTIHSSVCNNYTPCSYCNSYEEVDIYVVSKSLYKVNSTKKMTLCLRCHSDISKSKNHKTRLIEWSKNKITCDICNEQLQGGTYEIKT